MQHCGRSTNTKNHWQLQTHANLQVPVAELRQHTLLQAVAAAVQHCDITVTGIDA
jgi:hypothetical protein